MQRFDGPNPKRDGPRLSAQYRRIFDLMSDGQYRTLSEIAAQTGFPEASISAQLRHMRKRRFGGHQVSKEYLGRGLYSYSLQVQVAPPIIEQAQMF